MGTSMTAERVPSGGAAHDGGDGAPHGDGGPDGQPTTCSIEIECGEADCDAIVKAVAAMKEAGAAVHPGLGPQHGRSDSGGHDD